MTCKSIIKSDPWKELKEHTQARIAIGRAGVSVTSKEYLKFRMDHSKARDAVHIPLDIPLVKADFEKVLDKVIVVSTKAKTRAIYLKRPDLGRELDVESKKLLKDAAPSKKYDIAIAVADGLSADAVEKNACTFLSYFVPKAEKEGFKIAPLSIIEEGRVAAGDEIAELLNADIVAVLIGERPGLSSPDSMGIYMTYKPSAGTTDERRNCISNVREEGLKPLPAADKLLYLVKESIRRKISGVDLKDMQIDTVKKEKIR